MHATPKQENARMTHGNHLKVAVISRIILECLCAFMARNPSNIAVNLVQWDCIIDELGFLDQIRLHMRHILSGLQWALPQISC
jgi:hypothetical protein